MCLWAENNLYEIKEGHLHRAKITVWMAFGSRGIVGPIFVKETVTSESYHSLLADIIPESENWGLLKSTTFKQDSAKPHTSNVNLLLLQKTFKNRYL